MRCAFSLLAVVAAAAACSVDEDCGLLGDCVAGACACDAGWVGATCASLDLLPAPRDSGLRQSNSSNWCGTILRDENDADLYHSYNADFGGCANGLGIWLTGSRVIHSTSRGSAVGPFTPAWGAGDAEVAVFRPAPTKPKHAHKSSKRASPASGPGSAPVSGRSSPALGAASRPAQSAIDFGVGDDDDVPIRTIAATVAPAAPLPTLSTDAARTDAAASAASQLKQVR